MNNFEKFELPAPLYSALEKMQYTAPTDIQTEVIPLTLAGEDVIASSHTGSGKTGAFIIPIVAQLMQQAQGKALILTPTRELAMQVISVAHQLLGYGSGIRTALLIGGNFMPKQVQQLKANARIIVGTLGRINDHLQQGTLSLKDVKYLVLDETDRMLDMGFGVQLDQMVKYLPKERQTMMFSATMPPAIMKLAKKYLNTPKTVAMTKKETLGKNIQQKVLHVTHREKYDALVGELNNREGTVIVFVATKAGAEKLTYNLKDQGHSTEFMHGDLRQNHRARVINGFRNNRYRILVATDVAARGLDIPHIAHVINYDLPQSPEDYIHRIGRTARAGASGAALALVTPMDKTKWSAIRRHGILDNMR